MHEGQRSRKPINQQIMGIFLLMRFKCNKIKSLVHYIYIVINILVIIIIFHLMCLFSFYHLTTGTAKIYGPSRL